MREALKERGAVTMALCDTKEEYAQLMTEFLQRNRELPWELHTYTDVEELLRAEQEAALFVVAESACTPKLRQMAPGRLVVLNESGLMKWENLRYVDKYQKAEDVLQKLLEIFMEIEDTPLPRLKKSCGTVFIGNYSPVRRCMQTSLALTLSQMLAIDHTTLYLNFEQYAGVAELLPDMQTLDLADLLYFLNADREKFRLRMQTMVKHIGGLNYVPPMKWGQNLLAVTPAEWLSLFQKIQDLDEYEYVVLDLSESMQGLFQILRLCRKVITVTKEDRIAKSKILQYEHLLALCEFDDVLEKTKCLSLPRIRRLPEDLEQLTKGELAVLARELIDEICRQ